MTLQAECIGHFYQLYYRTRPRVETYPTKYGPKSGISFPKNQLSAASFFGGGNNMDFTIEDTMSTIMDDTTEDTMTDTIPWMTLLRKPYMVYSVTC